MAIDVTKPNSSETFAQIWADIRADLIEIVSHINDTTTAHGLATLLTSMADYITHKANTTNAHGIDVINTKAVNAQAEITTARGTKSTLAERLATAMQLDGALKLTALASRWIDNGDTPTYASTLSFTVAGDKTKVYISGSMIRATVSTGYVYGIVSSSSYVSPSTTVVFSSQYPVLTSPISKVEIALLSFDNTIESSVAQNAADILDLQSQFTALESYIDTIEGDPGQDGAGAWKTLLATDFTATPASTSALTMLVDKTAMVRKGMSLGYTIGGVEYFGRVNAITSGLLTVDGPPLSGNVTALRFGGGFVWELPLAVNGLYEDATCSNLLLSDNKFQFLWDKDISYIVFFKVFSVKHDSTTHGQVNVRKDTAAVCTANTNEGLTIAADATWYETGISIDTTNYKLEPGNMIELSSTKNGAGDAEDLTVIMIIVTP